MSDLDFVIEILLKARDEASPKIDALKAKIDSLKATNDAEAAERDLGRAVEDTGRKTDAATKSHQSHRTEIERSSRAEQDAHNARIKASEELRSAQARANAQENATARARSGNADSQLKLAEREKQLAEARQKWNDAVRAEADAHKETERARNAAADSLRGHTDALSGASATQRDFHKTLEDGRKARESASEDVKDLRTRVSELHVAWNDLDHTLKSGSLNKTEGELQVRKYASAIKSLAKETSGGSEELKILSSDLERVNKYLKDPNFGSTGGILRSFGRARGGDGGMKDIGEGIESLGHKFDNLGLRVSGVSSFLRGFFDLAKIGFSQQLLTGIASLAGGLISVGSAAAQAGAALGGAFVSGLGQAIPMLSIVIASVERFKNILQAVSVASQAEQQHFYNPTEKQVTQLSNISQLISAQQQLSNSSIQLFEAQQRVRDSQIALTEARYTAKRQITELALAEKNARLEAEGSDLALIEARRQLTIATQKGNEAGIQQAELAVRQAELHKKSSEFAIPKSEREARLARERGVSGAPSVISAREGVEGSRLAVIQAHQAAEAAQRQERITRLQQASRASHETQYEAQLKFLKSKMSPGELNLTEGLTDLVHQLKQKGSPLQAIADSMVAPFSDAVSRIRKLLKTLSFLGPIEGLAEAMGKGLGRLEKATYGAKGTSFFETMSKDAAQNIPIVVTSIEKLMSLFEEIAKAADPAFKRLSEDWAKFWGTLSSKYSSVSGLSKLEAFFNKSVVYAEDFGKLAVAIFDLFKAIGHDAAPQGLSLVESLTKSVESATKWIQGNGSVVTKFFSESREGVILIGRALFEIGKEIIAVFSLSSLRAFSGFLTQLLLPGLRDVITLFGKLTEVVLDFFNMFGTPGRKVLEVIGAGGAIVYGITKIIGVITKLKKAWEEWILLVEGTKWAEILSNPILAAIAIVGLAIAALVSTFSSGQHKNRISTEEVTRALEAQANAIRTIKNLSDEYKSSELGVKEARASEEESKRSLAKIRKEKVVPGEGETQKEAEESHKLAISRAEQSLERAKLDRQETERKFKELPKEQKETAQKSKKEIEAGTAASIRSKEQRIEEIHEVLPEQRKEAPGRHEAYKEIAQELKEEKKLKEEIPRIAKEGAEQVVLANREISKSTLETAGNATKISDAYAEAFSKLHTSVGKGRDAATRGMKEIEQAVNHALRKYGVNPAEANRGNEVNTGPGSRVNAERERRKGHASGAYIPARRGGYDALVAEGGHDEVILSTDPRHANRSRNLLNQYFSRAPHMAQGGPVGYESPFHGAVRWGRSDQGTDANLTPGSPITAIGDAEVKGIIQNWYAGQPYIWYKLLNGMDAGKYVYVAEQINQLAKVGAILKAGQPIAHYASSGTGLETGWATASGQTLARATSGYTEGQQTPAGKAFTAFLQGLASANVTAGEAVSSIRPPLIKGGGSFGRVIQGALNKVTGSANAYISRVQGGSGGARLSGGSVGHEILQYFIGRGLTRAQAAGIVGNAMQESSLNPNAPGGGLFQDIGGRGAGPGAGILAQLNAAWRELTGSERSTLAALKKTKSPAEAALLFSERFERPGAPMNANRERYAEEAFRQFAGGGLIANHIRRLATRHLRRKLIHLAEGGMAPWGGRPVPIIAHEGERIMNPAQYGETARLAGLSPRGLDSHLGYDSHPRQSFASGGAPTIASEKSQPSTGGISSAFSLPGLGRLIISANEIGTIKSVVEVMKAISEGFKKIDPKSPGKYKKDIETFFENIEKAFESLAEGREVLKAKLARKAVGAEYSETGIIPRRSYRKGGGLVTIGRINTGAVALGPGGETKVSEEAFKSLREENNELEKEIGGLRNARRKISQDIKHAKSKSSVQMFKAEYNNLVKKERELGELVTSNIEARYQAETQVIQSKLSEANSAYQTVSTEKTAQISEVQQKGTLSAVGGLETQVREAAENQLTALAPILKEAESIGNKELTASIKQEMTGLRQTVTSAVVETISNAQTEIQREAARAEASSGEKLSISKVLQREGKYAQGSAYEREGLEIRGSSLLSTRGGEETLRAEAEQKGDTAAVISLTEELNKNSAEIAENNLALRDNASVTRELVLGQTQREGAVGTGIYGGLKQGLETIGQTTGFYNVAGLLSAAKGESGILKQEQAGIEKTGSEIGLNVQGKSPAEILSYLASPEAQAIISSVEKGGSEAEKQVLEKTISALESNSEAILQNTKEIATLNGSLNQPQSFTTAAFQSFRNSIFTGMGNLLPQYGAALPPGQRPEGLPVFGAGSPGAPINTPTIGQINLTHPVEKLDPQLFGEELIHAISTTPATS